MCIPGRPGEFRQGDDYEALKALLAPVSAWLSNSSNSHSYPDQGDQRQRCDYEGVNSPLSPASALLSNSSTSHSDPVQGGEGDQRHEFINTFLPPVSALHSTSQSDSGQGDQGHQRHHKFVNTVLPPVSTLLNRLPYTEEQEETVCSFRKDCRMSWDRVTEACKRYCYADGTPWYRRGKNGLKMRYYSCQSLRAPSIAAKPGYTKEQEKAIRSLRKDRGMSWAQVTEAYNRHCYPDGTLWAPKSPAALQQRYYEILKAGEFSTSTSTSGQTLCNWERLKSKRPPLLYPAQRLCNRDTLKSKRRLFAPSRMIVR